MLILTTLLFLLLTLRLLDRLPAPRPAFAGQAAALSLDPEAALLPNHFHPIVETMNNEAPVQVSTVMIIDDCEIDIFIASRTLVNSGFTGKIITKKSAKEALTYLSANAHTPSEIPDLIFLDILMPRQNGFDFLEEFRLLDAAVKNKASIVMLSSSSDVEDLKRSIANRYVRKFVTKPITLDQVSETLEEIQSYAAYDTERAISYTSGLLQGRFRR